MSHKEEKVRFESLRVTWWSPPCSPEMDPDTTKDKVLNFKPPPNPLVGCGGPLNETSCHLS